MTDSKQKHGEYIKYDDSGRITNIDWYTDGNHDCSLDITDGEHTYTHGDGKLWQKYTLKGGKPDGEWVLYHSNTRMSFYRKFKNGSREGIWTGWHNDATRWMVETYKDDKENGSFKRWRYGEVPQFEGYYKDGKKTDKWIYYYESGIHEYGG